MNCKTLLAATLALPLLLVACDKEQSSPTAAVQSQGEDRAAGNQAPDRMLEKSPPAAGMPAPSDNAAPPTPAEPAGSASMNSPDSSSAPSPSHSTTPRPSEDGTTR